MPTSDDGREIGDVRHFDFFSRFYDVLVPSADTDTLERGIDEAERGVERVLDLAGGTGRVGRAIVGVGRDVVVVDASSGMVRQSPVPGVEGDASLLPFKDCSFDAVVCADALHHIADVKGVFDEVGRVLREGGVFVVSEFDPTTLRGRFLTRAEHLVGFDSVFYTPDELEIMTEDAGMSTRRIEDGFKYTLSGVNQTVRDIKILYNTSCYADR
ncbi:MAG: methyltransferase domain-containing protein [Halobacteria archaeon]|nr:methyltransferase domain-containing protein [Halobacteria archaeon]